PQYVSKRYDRKFQAGQTVSITDGVLAAERVAPPPPPAPEPKKVEPAPKREVAVAPPAPKIGTIADFEDPSAWKEEDGIWRHRGGAFLPYKSANGVFTFSIQLLRGGNIFRGGRVRWRANYVDDRNYMQFELDEDNFYSKEVVKGKSNDHPKKKHNLD